MATHSNEWQYSQDLPCAIQEKISLLSMFEGLIQNLEEQLNSIRKEHARLEWDVEPYRIRHSPSAMEKLTRDKTATSNDMAPLINRCPNEILYMIFEHCAHPQHRRIGELLFVCKRWNSILMRSPAIWAKIQVPHGSRFFSDYLRSRTLTYISTCIERSGQLLLDVVLSLEDIPTHSRYLVDKLSGAALEVVMPKDRDVILDLIGEVFGEVYTKPLNYEEQLNQFIDCISGAGGCHMKRWRSLSIILPSFEAAGMILWQRMSYPTPNLKFCSIGNLPIEDVSLEWLASHGPTDLSLVEQLTITQGNECVPLNALHLSANALKHLALDFDEQLRTLSSLRPFTSLQTLELIHKPAIYYSRWEPPDSSTWPILSIRLPQLKEITLRGNYAPLQAIHFDTPALETLTIQSEESFDVPPKLSAPIVRWRIQKRHGDKWEVEELRVAHDILSKMATKELVLPEFVRKIFRRNHMQIQTTS
jgi:F-box-like